MRRLPKAATHSAADEQRRETTPKPYRAGRSAKPIETEELPATSVDEAIVGSDDEIHED